MPEIKLGQKTVTYIIRESQRARRLSLKIDPENGLQVVIPAGSPVPNVESILREKQRWILRNLREIEDNQPNARDYTNGEMFLYLGENYPLEVIHTKRVKHTTVGKQGGVLRVRLKGGVDPKAQATEVRWALEGWYRHQAKVYIAARSAELAAVMGLEFQKITIKGQRTRWGSCSSQGNLNFNWRLMMAPPAAIDYVIIHELCHLVELNHSKRFWALVEAQCPAYKFWIQWFKDNQPLLFL